MQEYIDLLQRRFPGIDASAIRINLDPHRRHEAFTVRAEEDSLVIDAGSKRAVGVALNRWLRETARAHVSFLDSQPGLLGRGPLPLPRDPSRGESWADVVYFINYCFFSYSAAYWDWSEWERLIDWMALQGVTMPLAVTGQEAIWQRVFRRLGLSEQAFDGFVPGPAYLPFGWMGCMDGYTGPLPSNWIERRLELGQRIVARERELGMTPVLQGFTGHVPDELVKRHPTATVAQIRWADWETSLLDPMDPLFPEVASVFMEEQTALFGTDHLYAADPFIEMVPPSGDPTYLASLSRAILGGMTDTDPKARWIMQGWCFKHMEDSWTQEGIDAFLQAVPDEHLLVLDLACEERPMYLETDGFAGKPWIFGNVLNYGNNVTLSGAMEADSTGLAEARRSPAAGQLEGIGLVNEGLGVNPVAFDFLFEQAWTRIHATPRDWAADYAVHRYGGEHPAAREAWKTLAETVYRVWHHEASGIVINPATETALPVEAEAHGVASAWTRLLEAAGELGAIETYRFDLLNLARQAISNHGTRIKDDLRDALSRRGRDEFIELSEDMQTTLRDLDGLLACHPFLRLDTWLHQAERWGGTPEERAKLRTDALRQVTVWGLSPRLLDYARKEWSGLLVGFYAPRWESWTSMVLDAWKAGTEPDEQRWRTEQEARERAWVESPHLSFTPAAPDLISLIRALHGRYAGSGAR